MHRKKLIKSEVNKLFNTTSETLRYYEKMGFISPDVGDNNYRYYDFFDIQKLRQVFLYRNLGISIESIQQIMNENIEEGDYVQLLKRHQNQIKDQISALESTYKNVNHLIKLVQNNDVKYDFELKQKPKRFLAVVSAIDSNIMSSPKKYFDRYESVIKGESYSEKALHILYDYDALNHNEQMTSKICFQVNKIPKGINQKNSDLTYTILSKGQYLSVFYPFKRHDFRSLKNLKKVIDEYLKQHDLKLKDSQVIEIEHPELSLFLGEDTLIYEIQILVESIKKQK